jgi:hypothetical protein
VEADVEVVAERVVAEVELCELPPHPEADKTTAHTAATTAAVARIYRAPASLIRRSMSSSVSKSAMSACRYSTPSPLSSCARTST